MSERTSGELIGGRYALGELLGVGGTGSVFAAVDVGGGASGADAEAGVDADASSRRARSTTRQREVAVKLLHPHLCADAASRDAFLREAQHAMALEHPNVVRVHGAGLHDAAGVIMPWIALDRLHGPTLREWVDSAGRLSPADAATVLDGVLGGLAAAHAAGIVHRDISPQNVILDGAQEGQAGEALTTDMVRIVDFGLADVTGRSTLGSDVLLAAEGGASVVGNAAFMSPEQAQGLPVRSVSDLYQAGAVLYFALTGRPPFPRENTEQVLQAHVSAPPPVPSSLNPAARPLDRIVTRAMAKVPAHRFRDAEEFRAALRAALAATVPLEPVVAPQADGAQADGEPSTRLLPWTGSGDPLDYLSPVLPDGEAAANADRSSSRAGGGLAAGLAGFVILALAGWAVVAAAAAPTAPPPVVETTATPTPSDTPSASPSSIPSPSAVPSAAASVAPDVPVVTDAAVPALRGTLAEADAALRAAGLTLGPVTRVESAEAADRVLSQSPAAGERVTLGGAVTLTVASGSNVVPHVAGMTQAAATALLQSAGFTAAADRTDAPAGAAVTATYPAAGTVLRVGVTVTLVLAAPSAPPTPTNPTSPPTEAPSGGEG